MKIDSVAYDNRKKSFEIVCGEFHYAFPAALVRPRPTRDDPIAKVFVDAEIGDEGFTYVLRSGVEGTVHVDHVLAFHRDPAAEHRDRLYRLTLEAQDAFAESGIAKRALSRRLGTSLSQLARLLDQTNYTKSLEQMLRLLSVLGRDVQWVVVRRDAGARRAPRTP